MENWSDLVAIIFIVLTIWVALFVRIQIPNVVVREVRARIVNPKIKPRLRLTLRKGFENSMRDDYMLNVNVNVIFILQQFDCMLNI